MSSAASEIPLTANTDLPALWANLLGSGFSNPQLTCYVEETFSPFCVHIADLCAKYLTDVFCLLVIVFFCLFFNMCTRFKSLLNLLQYCFCFMLCFCILFCCNKVCGILAPWPGVKLAPPALEGEVKTIGLSGKSHCCCFKSLSTEMFCFSATNNQNNYNEKEKVTNFQLDMQIKA